MSRNWEGDCVLCPTLNAPQHVIRSGIPCLICPHHHLTKWNIIPPQFTITGVREESSITWYPHYPCPCNPIPLLSFCNIIFPLEPAHLAMEGKIGRLLMTAAREAGGNRSVWGLGEGDQWGGRSVHADGGGQDMTDEVGGQWGGGVFWLCLLVASTNS